MRHRGYNVCQVCGEAYDCGERHECPGLVEESPGESGLLAAGASAPWRRGGFADPEHHKAEGVPPAGRRPVGG